MKGEEPFDLAKAKNIFVVLASTAEKIPALFPASSKDWRYEGVARDLGEDGRLQGHRGKTRS